MLAQLLLELVKRRVKCQLVLPRRRNQLCLQRPDTGGCHVLQQPDAPLEHQDEPALLALQRALQALIRRASILSHLTENEIEVDAFCGCLETALAHKFKTRQFYMFTVHPWSLFEHAESWGEAEAEAVQLARSVGSSDAARLRAWLFVQLNQRSLQHSLSAVPIYTL